MNSPDLIRITREEATSDHVDDLLKRQMSMRGETGVTRSLRGRWYFRNWIVYGLAGALGAAVAWAVLEPIFDDELYVRGTITALDRHAVLPEMIGEGELAMELSVRGHGAVTVNGEKVMLHERTRELRPDGSMPPLALSGLEVGQRIGVYVEYYELPGDTLALANFVDLAPGEGADTNRTLEQLSARSGAAGLVMFGIVASLVGLFIGAVDGIVCRLPRRALLAGGVGLVVGLAGGFISSLFAGVIYTPLTNAAMSQMEEGGSMGALGFLIQMGGRALAWAVAGCAMGLGQGIALRSRQLLLFGLLGGLLGGVLGGLLFDPIDFLIVGAEHPSAHWSRLVGFIAVGGSVGVMMGLVELLARNAWLRMTQGPLTGKEFLVFKDVMKVGSSPRSDIYLFNDTAVAPNHALLRTIGDTCELEGLDTAFPVLVNNRPVQRARLRHGDNVTIGRTMFVYQHRKG